MVQALPNAAQQFASFVGGQVLDGNALYGDLWRLKKLGSHGYPNLLPTTGSFRLAFREAYAGTDLVHGFMPPAVLEERSPSIASAPLHEDPGMWAPEMKRN